MSLGPRIWIGTMVGHLYIKKETENVNPSLETDISWLYQDVFSYSRMCVFLREESTV